MTSASQASQGNPQIVSGRDSNYGMIPDRGSSRDSGDLFMIECSAVSGRAQAHADTAIPQRAFEIQAEVLARNASSLGAELALQQCKGRSMSSLRIQSTPTLSRSTPSDAQHTIYQQPLLASDDNDDQTSEIPSCLNARAWEGTRSTIDMLGAGRPGCALEILQSFTSEDKQQYPKHQQLEQQEQEAEANDAEKDDDEKNNIKKSESRLNECKSKSRIDSATGSCTTAIHPQHSTYPTLSSRTTSSLYSPSSTTSTSTLKHQTFGHYNDDDYKEEDKNLGLINCNLHISPTLSTAWSGFSCSDLYPRQERVHQPRAGLDQGLAPEDTWSDGICIRNDNLDMVAIQTVDGGSSSSHISQGGGGRAEPRKQGSMPRSPLHSHSTHPSLSLSTSTTTTTTALRQEQEQDAYTQSGLNSHSSAHQHYTQPQHQQQPYELPPPSTAAAPAPFYMDSTASTLSGGSQQQVHHHQQAHGSGTTHGHAAVHTIMAPLPEHIEAGIMSASTWLLPPAGHPSGPPYLQIDHSQIDSGDLSAAPASANGSGSGTGTGQGTGTTTGLAADTDVSRQQHHHLHHHHQEPSNTITSSYLNISPTSNTVQQSSSSPQSSSITNNNNPFTGPSSFPPLATPAPPSSDPPAISPTSQDFGSWRLAVESYPFSSGLEGISGLPLEIYHATAALGGAPPPPPSVDMRRGQSDWAPPVFEDEVQLLDTYLAELISLMEPFALTPHNPNPPPPPPYLHTRLARLATLVRETLASLEGRAQPQLDMAFSRRPPGDPEATEAEREMLMIRRRRIELQEKAAAGKRDLGQIPRARPLAAPGHPYPGSMDRRTGAPLAPRPTRDSWRCHGCGTTQSSVWCDGPDGPRSLCENCGYHYDRLYRKRDGGDGDFSSVPDPYNPNMMLGPS